MAAKAARHEDVEDHANVWVDKMKVDATVNIRWGTEADDALLFSDLGQDVLYTETIGVMLSSARDIILDDPETYPLMFQVVIFLPQLSGQQPITAYTFRIQGSDNRPSSKPYIVYKEDAEGKRVRMSGDGMTEQEFVKIIQQFPEAYLRDVYRRRQLALQSLRQDVGYDWPPHLLETELLPFVSYHRQGTTNQPPPQYHNRRRSAASRVVRH